MGNYINPVMISVFDVPTELEVGQMIGKELGNEEKGFKGKGKRKEGNIPGEREFSLDSVLISKRKP